MRKALAIVAYLALCVVKLLVDAGLEHLQAIIFPAPKDDDDAT